MNLKQAIKRIEELERRVRELESRPNIVTHYHYAQQPIYGNPISLPTTQPRPFEPYCTYAGVQSSGQQS